MAKKNNGLPKSKIEKLLKEKGLTLRRVTYRGVRVWHVSDGTTGHDFKFLKSIPVFYKLEL